MSTPDKWLGKYSATRSSINRARNRLAEMPGLLQTICVANMCIGIGFLSLCILQIGTFQINDETLSWEQLRAAGYYPFLIIDSLAMIVAGFGIWMRRGWSRWLVVLIYVITSPIEI